MPLRTPDQRFEGLPGFDFRPNYIDNLPAYQGLRMHFLDEGPSDGEVFLCLHGQPTWCYLYRKMLPVFTAAGLRVVAPDLYGFGRSDKPGDDNTYTFDFHRGSLVALIEALDLRDITLVCQDWGGILGLSLPVDMSGRFKRLLIMNTAFGTGDQPLGDGFTAWREWNNQNPDMAIGKLMSRSCPHLSPAECAAYDAPFPDASYKGGVRRFPNLVPDNHDAPGAAISRRARQWWTEQWNGPTFMAVGTQDPVLGMPVMKHMARIINGCPPPLALDQAGHFVQEWGDEVARAALAHFDLN